MGSFEMVGDNFMRKRRKGEIEIKEIYVEEEKEDDDNQDVCVICFDNLSNVILMECNHTGFCLQCVRDLLMKNNHNHCPICRGAVLRFVQYIVRGRTVKPIKIHRW